jgi:hypothetical protein
MKVEEVGATKTGMLVDNVSIENLTEVDWEPWPEALPRWGTLVVD